MPIAWVRGSRWEAECDSIHSIRFDSFDSSINTVRVQYVRSFSHDDA